MLTDFATWPTSVTVDPAISYVRAGSGTINSGGVGAAWTRPWVSFVPDRAARYVGVGVKTTPIQVTVGTSQDGAQYFTKWMLEKTTPALGSFASAAPSTLYSPARQAQILVKADRVNLMSTPGFESVNSTNVTTLTNLAVSPRATVHTTGTAGGFWSDRWGTASTFALTSTAGGGGEAGVDTYSRMTVTGSQSGLGWHLAENPDISAPPAHPSARMLTVNAGETITIRHRVRSSVAANWNIGVRFATNSTAWSGGTVAPAATALTANVWTTVSYTFVVPAGMTRLGAYSVSTGASLPIGATVDASALMITRTSAPVDYFDGTTRIGIWNHADFNSAWTGATDGSTSTLRAANTPGGVSMSNGVMARSSAWANSGSYSGRFVPNSPTSADSFAYIHLMPLGLKEGGTYTVSAKARQTGPLAGSFPNPNQQRNLFLAINGGGGGIRALTYDAPHPNVAGEHDHVLTFTIPKVDGSPVTSLELRFYHGSSDPTTHIWWDSILLEEGTSVGTYFDGSTNSDTMWELNGTAHASRSHYYLNKAERTAALNRAIQDALPMGISTSAPVFGVWAG